VQDTSNANPGQFLNCEDVSNVTDLSLPFNRQPMKKYVGDDTEVTDVRRLDIIVQMLSL
jgi:hypothetical protein